MRSRYWCGVVLAVLVSAACSGGGSSCTYLPERLRYCLQSTARVAPVDVQQKVDIAFNGREETMIAQLEVDAFGMRFAGMTPFGQKLLQIDYDNDRVRAETFFGKGVDPVLLFALVQLATWPRESVLAGFGDDSAVELIEDETHRRVVKNGKELVAIGYTQDRSSSGDMRIRLPSVDVEFAITNLDGVAPR